MIMMTLCKRGLGIYAVDASNMRSSWSSVHGMVDGRSAAPTVVPNLHVQRKLTSWSLELASQHLEPNLGCPELLGHLHPPKHRCFTPHQSRLGRLGRLGRGLRR